MNAGTEGNVLSEVALLVFVCCVREIQSGCCALGMSVSDKLLMVRMD